MIQTIHQAYFCDASRMSQIDADSVHLIVTSPPYPMIGMWDDLFCRHPATAEALAANQGAKAFEHMHRQLDPIWNEVWRVLIPGGIACINIGDATRTLGGEFALYPNHSRILTHMLAIGFSNLPNILWRKQTNAPNKFMGSGMMPPGAYVTLEHEYILIFRKGGKRRFITPEAKHNRRQSAFFWEERNQWFSDVWTDVKGTRQKTGDQTARRRSGAYPAELAYRLICMFSVMGDRIVDPFLGTGTTLFAAAVAARNSIGYEIDRTLAPIIQAGCGQLAAQGQRRIADRFDSHQQFVRDRDQANKPIKYTNRVYGFPVITRQETELMIPPPEKIKQTGDHQWKVSYAMPTASANGKPDTPPTTPLTEPSGQLPLFNQR